MELVENRGLFKSFAVSLYKQSLSPGAEGAPSPSVGASWEPQGSKEGGKIKLETEPGEFKLKIEGG